MDLLPGASWVAHVFPVVIFLADSRAKASYQRTRESAVKSLETGLASRQSKDISFRAPFLLLQHFRTRRLKSMHMHRQAADNLFRAADDCLRQTGVFVLASPAARDAPQMLCSANAGNRLELSAVAIFCASVLQGASVEVAPCSRNTKTDRE